MLDWVKTYGKPFTTGEVNPRRLATYLQKLFTIADAGLLIGLNMIREIEGREYNSSKLQQEISHLKELTLQGATFEWSLKRRRDML